MLRFRRVHRQEHRVKLVRRQGPAQDFRVVVAGDADEPHPAPFPGVVERLQRPAGGAQGLDFVHGPDIVHLPQIQVIRIEILQGDAEMGHGLFKGAPMGFAGEEDFVPVAFQAAAQVGLAAGVGPGGFEVIDPGRQGRLNHGLGLAVVTKGPQHAFASQAQPGGGVPGASQGFLG